MPNVKAPAKRHTCMICHGRIPAGKAIYSPTTRNRYCRDVNACQKRARKAARSC